MYALLLRVFYLVTGIDKSLSILHRSVHQIALEQDAHREFLAQILAEQSSQRALLHLIASNVTPPPKVVFTVRLSGQTSTGVSSVLLKANQEFDANVAFTDAKGNPAPVDGTPTWENSNTDLLTVTTAEDGLSAVIVATGTPGTGQVVVKADADLGDGVVEIIGTLDVEVVPGDAVTVVINTGPARDQVANPEV